MHGVVARDVLQPEAESLLIEQQRASAGRAVRSQLVDEHRLGRCRRKAERSLCALPRHQERGAAGGRRSDLRGGQPVQALVLMRGLPGQVAGQHGQQCEGREREPAQSEHGTDGRERDQVAQRKAAGAAREDAGHETEGGDLQGAGPAPRLRQGERREEAEAQQREHDSAHRLVSGHRAHQRQRVHEPADQARRPGQREHDQPPQQPHRGTIARSLPPAEQGERWCRRAQVERAIRN